MRKESFVTPKYWNDNRTPSEKLLTKQMILKISEENISRKKLSFSGKLLTQMLFVTVAGVPPQEKEFDSYSFPGKVISFYPPCFAPGETDESMEQNLGTISMANTVGLIDKIVSNNGNRVIFVYHSFGGSIVANYCSKHHKKVFGLVSLGGPSISFYPILKDFARSLYSIEGITDQFVRLNYETVYSLYSSKMDKYPSKIRFKNKYQLLSFTLHNMPEVLSTLFENIRSLPRPILFISGQKDSVITEDLVYEAAAHLLSESPMTILEQPPRKIMENTSHKILQLQRRLIYILPGGHSIHLSHQQTIQSYIDDYLTEMLPTVLTPKL